MNAFSSCRTIAAVAILAFICSFASAQQPLDENERDKVFSEMRTYKHDFLTRSLNLSKEQQRDFFPVYDELDDRLIQLNKETRDLERSVCSDKNASDTEIDAAAAAVYSQKEREGKIEMEYYSRFQEILTPRQLLHLKSAEKRFTQKLVRHHRRLSGKTPQKENDN